MPYVFYDLEVYMKTYFLYCFIKKWFHILVYHFKTRQQNGPKLEILQTAINTCLIIDILSLWLMWKKKKDPT